MLKADSPQIGNDRKVRRIALSMNFRNVVLTVFFMTIPAFGQPFIGHYVSLGVAGGVGLTDAFTSQTEMGVDVVGKIFSGSKDYIVGPTIEVHLPLRLSVEFDALYRPLNLTFSNTIVPNPTPFAGRIHGNFHY